MFDSDFVDVELMTPFMTSISLIPKQSYESVASEIQTSAKWFSL